MEKHTLNSMIPIDSPPLETIYKNKREADKARAILQHLFFIRITMKRQDNFAPGIDRSSGWCPVKAENLKLIVRNYPEIMRTLVTHRIVEFKQADQGRKNYLPGMYTMLYRVVFGAGITHPDQQKYRQEKITCPAVIWAVKRYHQRVYENKRVLFLSDYPWYAPHLSFTEKLHIDATPEELGVLSPEDPYSLPVLHQQFNGGLGRHISRDLFAGRIHSHLTNLPKMLRPYLRLKDEDSTLVIADVKSAQPYFLGMLFANPGLIQLIPEFAPLASKIERYSTEPDVRLFFEDCSSGRFYVRLMELTGCTKHEVKEKLFQHVFYCSPSNHHQDEEIREERRRFQELFKSIYPSVFKVLTDLKRTPSKVLPFVHELTRHGKKRGRMYVVPNMVAQRLETTILLGKVTRMSGEQDVDTATIHDAWILRQEDLGRFEQIFSEVFHELGVKPPQLDIKNLTRGISIEQ